MSKKVCADTVIAPGCDDVGRDALVDLQVEVGRHQPNRAVLASFDEDVGEDRDGVAALHDRLDVAEALQEDRPLNRRFHRFKAPHPRSSRHYSEPFRARKWG